MRCSPWEPSRRRSAGRRRPAGRRGGGRRASGRRRSRAAGAPRGSAASRPRASPRAPPHAPTATAPAPARARRLRPARRASGRTVPPAPPPPAGVPPRPGRPGRPSAPPTPAGCPRRPARRTRRSSAVALGQGTLVADQVLGEAGRRGLQHPVQGAPPRRRRSLHRPQLVGQEHQDRPGPPLAQRPDRHPVAAQPPPAPGREADLPVLQAGRAVEVERDVQRGRAAPRPPPPRAPCGATRRGTPARWPPPARSCRRRSGRSGG